VGVRGDLAKIGEADALVERGKLLAAHAHSIPRGAKEATLEDWSTGEPRATTIALDPSKSARDQAEALFSRAKRMRRGESIARARLAEAERSEAMLRDLRDEAGAAEDDRALEIAEKRAHLLGARATKQTSAAKGREPPRLPYNVFTSGGREVFVGRGAKDNDALTTKVARPHDLWLHAKNRTGAHVVVPLSKNESCPTELLVDAAHLAAHFSDARGESIVEVQYVPRRFVRKPRGSAPGAVVVEREKVIVLRVEPPRLTRLLSTQNPS